MQPWRMPDNGHNKQTNDVLTYETYSINIEVIGDYIHTRIYDNRDDFGFPLVEW